MYEINGVEYLLGKKIPNRAYVEVQNWLFQLRNARVFSSLLRAEIYT